MLWDPRQLPAGFASLRQALEFGADRDEGFTVCLKTVEEHRNRALLQLGTRFRSPKLAPDPASAQDGSGSKDHDTQYFGERESRSNAHANSEV